MTKLLTWEGLRVRCLHCPLHCQDLLSTSDQAPPDPAHLHSSCLHLYKEVQRGFITLIFSDLNPQTQFLITLLPWFHLHFNSTEIFQHFLTWSQATIFSCMTKYNGEKLYSLMENFLVGDSFTCLKAVVCLKYMTGNKCKTTPVSL